jgi:spermidine/putrescine-binding protein
MRKLLLIGLAMAILINGPALAAKDELRIYIWSEYMDERLFTSKNLRKSV